MVDDASGGGLEAGSPAHTGDGRLWDGTGLFRLRDARVRSGVAPLLRDADVVVENRADCCPGELACGSLRVLGAPARRRLADAGFVRFRERGGHVQVWDGEDGRVLVLLAGEVLRPSLR